MEFVLYPPLPLTLMGIMCILLQCFQLDDIYLLDHLLHHQHLQPVQDFFINNKAFLFHSSRFLLNAPRFFSSLFLSPDTVGRKI